MHYNLMTVSGQCSLEYQQLPVGLAQAFGIDLTQLGEGGGASGAGLNHGGRASGQVEDKECNFAGSKQKKRLGQGSEIMDKQLSHGHVKRRKQEESLQGPRKKGATASVLVLSHADCEGYMTSAGAEVHQVCCTHARAYTHARGHARTCTRTYMHAHTREHTRIRSRIKVVFYVIFFFEHRRT